MRLKNAVYSRIVIRMIMMVCLCIITFELSAQRNNAGVTFILRGKVIEAQTGEAIIGANVYLPELKRGATTNSVGEYRLWLNAGQHTIEITSVGFTAITFDIAIQQDTVIEHKLESKTSTLEEVVVLGEDDRVSSLRLGQNRLDVSTLKKVPPLLGEPDIVRALLLMPGVSTVGEGATGYNVRGGSVDQNLILLDDAPIFNVSHLFGFLTAFNSNAVLNAELYKAGIPSSYGGRVASVLDVKVKQGNSYKLSGSAGVGLMAANLMLEGPIIRERTTFLISARGSYSDWLLRTIPEEEVNKSNAAFNDITIKLSHAINKNNFLSFTGYRSHDDFSFPGDTTYGWGTQNFTLKFGSTLRSNLFLMTTLVSSDYKYKVQSRAPTNEFDWNAGVNYLSAKTDASLTINEKSKADFGIGAERYNVNLGNLVPINNSNYNPFHIDNENGLILFAFLSYQIEVNEKLSMRAGLRGSTYSRYGPSHVNVYQPGVPRNESTYIRTDIFSKGDKIQSYNGLEPRFSVQYSLNKNSSVKAGYDHTIQYLQLVSNTSAVSPIDLWKLSDTYLKPQTGDQYSLGYFRRINVYQLSAESFYKEMDHVIDYKDGADLLLNDRLEADLLQGEGRAYGIEWMFEKKQGKLTGWLSYTLSRTERKIASEFPEENVSKGEYYPANYDKTHNLSFTASYQKNSRVSWGFNFVFATGRPITYPSSTYDYGGVRVVNFEYRNNERSPSYHRLDLSLEIKSKERPERKWRGTWVVSLYNVYARRNPYSIFFRSDYGTRAQSYRLAVIGTIVPSISYTISF